MAVSTIKVDEFQAAKDLSRDFTKPSLSNGTHYSTGCRYAKMGAFAYIYISVEFSSPPENKLLFTLPDGYRPLGTTEIPVSGGETFNAKAQCYIASNGRVYVTSADKYVIGGGIFLHS